MSESGERDGRTWEEKSRARKTWGVIDVGKRRGFYWLAWRSWIEHSMWFDPSPAAAVVVDSPENEQQWLIAEGFARTREEARELAQAAMEQAPGDYDWDEFRLLFPRRKRHYDGDHDIHRIYRRRHARKHIPKPGTATDARAESALGNLWRSVDTMWEKHPITKITAKKIWIADDTHYRDGDRQQRSFDRAELENKGHVFLRYYYCYYTDAGKEACEREWHSHAGNGASGHFPLLALIPPFTRRDVLRAFRRRSLELHPDQGGDAAGFRELVAERERALSTATKTQAAEVR